MTDYTPIYILTWNPKKFIWDMSGIRVKSKYVPKIWEIVNEQDMSVKW